MSSTNRGYERHKTDYYVTPQKPIKEFLKKFIDDENLVYAKEMVWLDPCAGGDKNHPMSYPEVIEKVVSPSVISTIDIREDSLAEQKQNFLDFSPVKEWDVVITNPPFFLAKEIIEHSLKCVKNEGYVVMLLRLNFLGSKGRREFLQNNMPKSIYVHSKRMSFTDNNKTDSIEYAHFVWQKGFNFKESKLKIL